LQTTGESSYEVPHTSCALKDNVQSLVHVKVCVRAPWVHAPEFCFQKYRYGGVPLSTTPVQETPPPLEEVKWQSEI
jgi:hypothetical protein